MVGYTESLNISVSAAIIIQDVTNRLRQSNINWQLSEEEILEKRLYWTENQLKISILLKINFYEIKQSKAV